MIVCGLDLSLTSSGIAILRDGELAAPLRSVGHKGSDGDDYAHRSRRIVSQCRAVIDAVAKGSGADPLRAEPWNTRIDLAVIEGPAFNMLARPSGHDGAGLWWGVFSAFASKRIPIAVIAPTTLKLWWTGDGHADKRRMLDTARARVRPAVSTFDEADALSLACAGAFYVGDPIPFEPSERQRQALIKVDWPEGIPAACDFAI